MGRSSLSFRFCTPILWGLLDESAGTRGGDGLLPGRRLEPGHDGRNVMLRGLGRDTEAPRDLRIAQAFSDQAQDLDLAARESRRIGPGSRYGTARHGARSAGAQLPAY